MLDRIWKCADGREMFIHEMDDRHIQNCINKIRRSGNRWRAEFLDRLVLEQTIRAMGLNSRRVM